MSHKCTAFVLGKLGENNLGSCECGVPLPCKAHNRDLFKNLADGQRFELITTNGSYGDRFFTKVDKMSAKGKSGHTWLVYADFEVEISCPAEFVPVHLSSLELQSLDKLCEQKDMTRTALLKQALRYYVLCQSPDFQAAIAALNRSVHF